jgi:iron complex outermembrane receptor protein
MHSIRSALLGSSILLAVSAIAALAHAQTSNAPPSDSGTPEVIVTGSRIPQANLEQPTPVSVMNQDLIQNSGTANLGDILAKLPAIGFTGTLRSNSNNFGSDYGVSSINLRDLGLSRTLVLVDGYRHVAGDINTDAVDVNSIPTALVDHVEVITGGASAIYGSDAVTGVVNIVLKKKFEGVDAQVQAGGDDNGYGAQYSAQATVGHSFLDGKLNVNFTGYWSKQAGVDYRNLPNEHNYGTILNPNDLCASSGVTAAGKACTPGQPIVNDGIPDRLLVQNVGSEFVTQNGVLLNVNTDAPQFSFNSAGQLIPNPQRTGNNSFAFGQLPANCQDCFFTDQFQQLASPFESKGAEFRASYDFTPHVRAFVDAKYSETNTSNTIQPSFSFGDFQLQPDNAFIQPDLRAALNAAGLTAANPADFPLISKFLNPGRVGEAYRRTYRIVAGLEGDFNVPFFNIKWDTALNYGRTNDKFNNGDLEFTQNFDAALDSVIDPATGQAACRINVPSAAQTGMGAGAAPNCVPFNPFGLNNSKAALAYSFQQFDTTDSLSQQDATINLRTDTSKFFNLPGGPISLATGGEYRMERTFEINDPRLVAGDTENLDSNSSGGFNVYEGYVEGAAPIFKHNGPWLDELSFDAAYRGAQYSFKQVGYADAYKFGTVYGPFDWIKFRGTYSRAIRAPNITEAFQPSTPGFFSVTDPCSVENIASNVNYAKNCAAAGIPAGFVANTNASIQGTSSGNPNLNPEKSFSYTGGVVLQPSFIPHLALTLDYYSIKIKNAIELVQAQDAINNCFNDSAGLNQQFCSLFTRDPATQNINFVSTSYVNASKLETDGFDFTATYSTPISGLTERSHYTKWLNGRVTFDLTANYIIKDHDFPFQDDPTQVHIYEGTVNNPHLKALADIDYRQGQWQVVWSTRYVGRAALFTRDPTESDFSESTNVPFAPARFYHNIAVHYNFTGGKLDNITGGKLSGLEGYAGVNNIFGDLPPFATLGQLDPAQNTADVGYDIGRFIFVGLKYKH